MVSKLPPIPIQLQTFRKRTRRWRRWQWLILGGLATALLIWLVFFYLSEPEPLGANPASVAGTAGPPWQIGNPEARFTVVFYADLECPHCKEYSPQLREWIGAQQDVNLQWHHLPLSIHEPAAGQEARMVECAGQGGGQEAFWTAVQWVYANTRSDGKGVADVEAFPGMSSEFKACMKGEEAASIVQAQSKEASASGITATPSLRLVDRLSGSSMVLPGPVSGDSLLSAIDLLAANEASDVPSVTSSAARSEAR